MSCRHYAMSGRKFGWVCWSVNFPKSSKEQDSATNIGLNSDSTQDQLQHSGDILHSVIFIVTHCIKKTLLVNNVVFGFGSNARLLSVVS